jgi:hypothetical protein
MKHHPHDKFTFCNSNRDYSIRIPLNVQLEGKGYFKDRRSAANKEHKYINI